MDADLSIVRETVEGLSPNASYRSLLKAARVFRRHCKSLGTVTALPSFVPARMAVVGNATVSFLGDPLLARLAGRGVAADIQLGNYGGYLSELVDSESEILAAQPEFIVAHLDHHAINEWPTPESNETVVRSLVDNQVSLWNGLWDRAHSACGATVIATNIAVPPERPHSFCDSTDRFGYVRFARRINEQLVETAPSFVTYVDAEHLSGVLGKHKWFDLPHWYASRQSVGFEGVSLLSGEIAGAVASHLGRTKKCLVLDLDNTLWGGVVGDVGWENLRLQHGDSVGEAHLDFQRYCKQLKERGVLLAVCSKNDESIAREAFVSIQDMVLRLEDISAFVANWDDKATNLRAIASQLNIGLDSMVFVDDNPAERALVREWCPSVSVPELPTDPAMYARTLDEHHYFLSHRLSSEDIARSEQYQAQLARQDAESQFSSMQEFLSSLDQVCTILPINESTLPRVAQLLNKTNQFNFTTRRFAPSELEALLNADDSLAYCVRHADRFGDNGIIAVLIATRSEDALRIDDWVMSCRVFKRGIEDLMFGALVQFAVDSGISRIEGLYAPTQRNRIVANTYRDYGLHPVDSSEGEEGVTQRWASDDLLSLSIPEAPIDCDMSLSVLFNTRIAGAIPEAEERSHEPRVA